MGTLAMPGVGAPAPANADNVKKSKRATFVAVLGTFIEYYDFSIYGYVAATIAQVFFPKANAMASLLDTLAVFGLAFLIRPLGAWFFGHLGDKRGRRTSLIASIVLMGVVVLFVHVWTRRPLQALRGDGKWSARMYPACLKGTAFTCPQPR